MTEFREEADSLGTVKVPADKLWGRRRSARLCTSASAKI
jgi:fumarate hydratase class II